MGVVRSTYAILATRVVGISGQAIIFIYLANRLTQIDFGIFSAVYVYWGLVRMLGPLGFDQVVLRETAAAIAVGDSEYTDALKVMAVKWWLVSSFVATILTLVALACLRMWGHTLSLALILATSAAVPAHSLIAIFAASLRGSQRVLLSQFLESIGLVGLTLCAGLALDLVGKLDLAGIVLAQAIVGWLVALLYAYFIGQIRWSANSIRLDVSKLRKDAFQIWQALAVTGLAVRVPTYVGVLMLGPAKTAVLEIAIRFGTLPTIFTTSVSATAAPALASAAAKGDRLSIEKTLIESTVASSVPSALVLIAFGTLGPFFLARSLPPAYEEAFVPLLLVTSATLINAIFGIASTFLLMSNRQSEVRRFSTIQLVTVGAGAIVLGYLGGVSGIAIAILIGSFVRDLSLAIKIRAEVDPKRVLAVTTSSIFHNLLVRSRRTGSL
ncbi:hypothetical protein EAS56_26355 [Bradyrhizobium guangzhouense]|uniref:Polysaccharide biosynthesis protein n=1 Tax=Bradyrhizobium guangzhouense TaxID=1325095 RepID=A0ABY0E0H7_9BRAD|nr:oligosaccharide flippase family protein [Bradyrhizobium guangzhouense]RXH09184.1 hypothetical protein EAS56_26355 [Bradyrhizobium guangzhouense]